MRFRGFGAEMCVFAVASILRKRSADELEQMLPEIDFSNLTIFNTVLSVFCKSDRVDKGVELFRCVVYDIMCKLYCTVVES